jgi:hypothetical protein
MSTFMTMLMLMLILEFQCSPTKTTQPTQKKTSGVDNWYLDEFSEEFIYRRCYIYLKQMIYHLCSPICCWFFIYSYDMVFEEKMFDIAKTRTDHQHCATHHQNSATHLPLLSQKTTTVQSLARGWSWNWIWLFSNSKGSGNVVMRSFNSSAVLRRHLLVLRKRAKRIWLPTFSWVGRIGRRLNNFRE